MHTAGWVTSQRRCNCWSGTGTASGRDGGAERLQTIFWMPTWPRLCSSAGSPPRRSAATRSVVPAAAAARLQRRQRGRGQVGAGAGAAGRPALRRGPDLSATRPACSGDLAGPAGRCSPRYVEAQATVAQTQDDAHAARSLLRRAMRKPPTTSNGAAGMPSRSTSAPSSGGWPSRVATRPWPSPSRASVQGETRKGVTGRAGAHRAVALMRLAEDDPRRRPRFLPA